MWKSFYSVSFEKSFIAERRTTTAETGELWNDKSLFIIIKNIIYNNFIDNKDSEGGE